MISTGDLKKGVAIELDGELWQILDYHHIKMGRGSAQVRITLRNIKRGQTVERSFQAGTKWPRASMEKRPVQFLYRDGDDHHFMDNDTYDQFILTTDQLGETAKFLTDGMTLDRTSYQGETIGVELPVTASDVRTAVETRKALLDEVVTPALVHFDLWRGNVLLDRSTGHWEIAGIIDGERAMWADPAAEFVSLSLLADIADDAEFLAGYRSVRPAFELTSRVRERVSLYRMYLDLIMLVEAVPRGYRGDDAHADFLREVAAELARCVAELRG